MVVIHQGHSQKLCRGPSVHREHVYSFADTQHVWLRAAYKYCTAILCIKSLLCPPKQLSVGVPTAHASCAQALKRLIQE